MGTGLSLYMSRRQRGISCICRQRDQDIDVRPYVVRDAATRLPNIETVIRTVSVSEKARHSSQYPCSSRPVPPLRPNIYLLTLKVCTPEANPPHHGTSFEMRLGRGRIMKG